MAWDWNLRACSRHGHATYAPVEADLASRLQVQTPLGESWRCLRCGTWVLGVPSGRGPATAAPEIRRGRALRDAFILRMLAVERFFRAALLVAAGIAVLEFESSQTSVQAWVEQTLPAAEPLARAFNIDLATSPTVEKIQHLLRTSPQTLTWVAVALFGYAAIQVVEGVGLALLKRWGEYFAVVATSVFLPLEVYELTEKITWVRVGALVVNLAAVAYLLWTKRLFGLRGGRAAYEAERAEESLLEVERAALAVPVGDG